MSCELIFELLPPPPPPPPQYSALQARFAKSATGHSHAAEKRRVHGDVSSPFERHSNAIRSLSNIVVERGCSLVCLSIYLSSLFVCFVHMAQQERLYVMIIAVGLRKPCWDFRKH